jgi:hypothetical protein
MLNAHLALLVGSPAISQQWRAVHERRRLVAPISEQTQARLTLERFTRGHPDNSICWDRDGIDGFINVIDAHQHPVPFGGPEVPFSLYTDWFIQHGTVFSVFMGIGQRITKQNASAPDCCYYLHCPTYTYPVIPKTESDEINAIAKLEHYYGKVDHRLHLITAATFPNLQRSEGALEDLKGLWKKYPKTFKWLGEINVFKHALAGNAFFSDFVGPRLTVARVESGELDALFSVIGPEQPNGEHVPAATLHSDMGCDVYAFPEGAGDGITPLKCEASDEEKRVAQKDYLWWKATLGEFYTGFFDENNYPKHNFRKIMHIHVTDSLIARYKEVKFVWAHVGLCMELTTLHPAVHAKILQSFFERHATNMWLDTSWDVLAKQNFVNFDGKPIEETLSSWAHEDLTDDGLFDMPHWTRERERLDKIWQVQTWTRRTGPPAAFAPSAPPFLLSSLPHTASSDSR